MPFSYPVGALMSRAGLRLMTAADAASVTGPVSDLERAVSQTTISVPYAAVQRNYTLTLAARSAGVEADFVLMGRYPS